MVRYSFSNDIICYPHIIPLYLLYMYTVFTVNYRDIYMYINKMLRYAHLLDRRLFVLQYECQQDQLLVDFF